MTKGHNIYYAISLHVSNVYLSLFHFYKLRCPCKYIGVFNYYKWEQNSNKTKYVMEEKRRL